VTVRGADRTNNSIPRSGPSDGVDHAERRIGQAILRPPKTPERRDVIVFRNSIVIKWHAIIR
jgi:hypothetical protein